MGFLRSANLRYQQRLVELLGISAIQIIPAWEASGVVAEDISGNANHGAHSNTVLANLAAPWGRSIPQYNGINSLLNLYSAGMAADFNPAQGTALLLLKIPSAVWTDGVLRRLFTLRADNNNIVYGEKHTTPNSVRLSYTAGGTGETAIFAVALETLFVIGLTWDKTAEQVRFVVNGCQMESTRTALGIWSGALSPTSACIGSAATTPGALLSGWAGPWVLCNQALSMEKIMEACDLILARNGTTKLLYYGDSKTEAGQYQMALTQIANVSGVNLGIGGRTTAQAKAAVDAEFASCTISPRYILYNLGANDVSLLPSEVDWKTNTLYVLDAMHTKWPGARVHMMRVWHRDFAANSATLRGWQNDVISARPDFVTAGPDESVFLEGGDNGATYTTDGVHPNVAGYQLTAQQWKTVLGL